MKFGLFGGASSRRGGVARDSTQGYRDFIGYVEEAEELGYHSVFLVEHHFTGFGQVSSSLNLLTYLAARTSHMRLGTAVDGIAPTSDDGFELLGERFDRVVLATDVGWQRGSASRRVTSPAAVRRGWQSRRRPR